MITLPEDLTYEQFHALAEREPSLEGDWIYRVRHVHFGTINSYPEFDIWHEEYLFLSFHDAESFIRERADDNGTYRFEIAQIPIGKAYELYDIGVGWIYDNKGKLLDYSSTTWDDNSERSIFYGRPKSRMRFKRGNIVEVVCDDHVHLSVVAANGPSVDWVWMIYSEHSGLFAVDASDDNYYVLDGPGQTYHSHPHALSLMKPSRPIPDDVREYFEYCLECGLEEDCRDVYKSSIFSENNMGECSNNSVKITFDEITKRHHIKQVSYDEVTNTIQDSPIREDNIEDLSQWLNEVKYGKTRLWYLIRNWNEKCCMDNEAYLPLDTPLSELL